jgi:hypothetical protein
VLEQPIEGTFLMSLFQRYSLAHWTLARHAADAYDYRPRFSMILRRLPWTFAMLFLMAAVHTGYIRFVERALPTPPVEAGLIQEAEPGAVIQINQIAGAAYTAALVLCLLVAVYAPLITFIERLRISKDVRGNLVITRQRILANRRQWPRGAFRSIDLYCYRGRSSLRGDQRHWRVSLSPQEGLPSMLEFDLGSVSTRKVPGLTPPRKVVEFVQHMKRLTGLPAQDPVYAEFPQTRRRSLLPKVSISIGPSVRECTFGSSDEIPDEMRPHAAALIAEARAKAADKGWSSGTYTASTFRITDDQGVTRTYNSFDELPEEVQARLGQMRQGENRIQ